MAIPGRKFKKEGDLYIVEKEEKKPIHLLLFSDILVGTKVERNGTYKYKLHVDLKKTEVVKKSVSARRSKKAKLGGLTKLSPTKSGSLENAIMLILEDSSHLVFTSNSMEEKDEWRRELETICDSFYSKRGKFFQSKCILLRVYLVFGIPLWELARRKHRCVHGIPLVLHTIFETFSEEGKCIAKAELI